MAPSPAIGAHRYIFVLFKGAIPTAKADDRICWDVNKWMNEHPNLTPVAMKCVPLLCAACLTRCAASLNIFRLVTASCTSPLREAPQRPGVR